MRRRVLATFACIATTGACSLFVDDPGSSDQNTSPTDEGGVNGEAGDSVEGGAVDGGARANLVCSEDHWCFLSPRPFNNPLRSIWGVSADDVWGVSVNQLMHYTNGSWVPVSLPVASKGWKDLHTIWGTSATDVWLGARDGALHYDGTKWTLMFNAQMFGIAGAASNDIWGAAGDEIYHYDGNAWTQKFVDVKSGAAIAVSAKSANDVWILCNDNTSLHWNGSTWTHADIPGDNMLNLAASGPNEAWAVGENNSLAHFVGGAWQPVTYGAGKKLHGRSIAALAPNDVMFLAFEDFSFHGQAFRYDGATWTSKPVRDPDIQGDLTGLQYFAHDSAWVGGDNTLSRLGPNDTWTSQLHEAFHAGRVGEAITGGGPDDVWAVGGQSVFHWEKGDWVEQKFDNGQLLHAIWRSSSGDIWVFGENVIARPGTDGIFKYDPTFPDGIDVRSVWGASPNDVWGVGRGGVIVHYDGNSWKNSASPVTTDLWSIAGTPDGDVWAVGEKGTFLHLVGGNWQKVTTSFTDPIRAIAAAGDQLWAASYQNAYHLVGSNWVPVPLTDFRGDALAVWGASATEIWIGGSNGALAHFDGVAWKLVESGSDDDINAMWGSSPNDIWAVGWHRTLRYIP